MDMMSLLSAAWLKAIPALFGEGIALIATYFLYLREMPLRQRIWRLLALLPLNLFAYALASGFLTELFTGYVGGEQIGYGALLAFAVYSLFALAYIFSYGLLLRRSFRAVFNFCAQVLFAYLLSPLLARSWWGQAIADVCLTGAVLLFFWRDFSELRNKRMDKNARLFLELSLFLAWIGLLAFSQAQRLLPGLGAEKFTPEALWIGGITVLLWMMQAMLVKSSLRNYRSNLEKEAIAATDPLTGLPNSAGFAALASQYLSQGGKGKELAYLYFNADHFRLFNESYGFREGDAFIKSLAQLLRQEFAEPNDIIARESASHFVALVEPRDLENRLALIHERMKDFGRDIGVEVKAGIYIRDPKQEGNSVDDVGHDKDKAAAALALIKDKKKSPFSYYQDSAEKIDGRNLYIANNLQNAIENGWIKVYYQPVISLKDNKVVSYEALARWDDPTYGLLSPGQFLPVLEKARLIYDLDRFILERICIDIRLKLNRKAKIVPIGFNISTQNFERINVPELLSSTLGRYGVPKRCISVQVDQAMALVSTAEGPCRCDYLRERGYRVCLVGFGDYRSSIAILKDHVFDEIKIDFSYMRRFSDAKSKRLLKTLVSAGKDAGAETVVEGIESRAMHNYAVTIGAVAGQGFYYCYPAPLAEVERILEQKGIDYPTIQLEEPAEEETTPTPAEETPSPEVPNLLNLGGKKPSFLSLEEGELPELEAAEEPEAETPAEPQPAVAKPQSETPQQPVANAPQDDPNPAEESGETDASAQN